MFAGTAIENAEIKASPTSIATQSAVSFLAVVIIERLGVHQLSGDWITQRAKRTTKAFAKFLVFV